MIKGFSVGCFGYRIVKCFFVLFLTVIVGFGCGGSSSDDPSGTANPAGTVDNSRFYATYDVTMQIGGCGQENQTVTVGNNQSRADEDGYVYVPEFSNSETLRPGRGNTAKQVIFNVRHPSLSLGHILWPCKAPYLQVHRELQHCGRYNLLYRPHQQRQLC